MTSDLSIDEELALHSIGWEPIELVVRRLALLDPHGRVELGPGRDHLRIERLRPGVRRGQRPHPRASAPKPEATAWSACTSRRTVHRHHVDVSPGGHGGPAGRIEAACPPTRSSCPTSRAATSPSCTASGWAPLGLAVGASFVYAPRRTVGVAIKQNRRTWS